MLEDDALDDVLRTLGPEHPSAALRDRVIAAAPRPRDKARGGRRLWWSLGAGWAAAGVAGLILGAAVPLDPAADLEQAFAVEDGLWPEDVG